MKISVLSLALPLLASAARFSDEEYRSGAVHQKILDLKQTSLARQRAAGDFDPRRWASWDRFLGGRWREDYVRCRGGKAVVEEGNPLQTFRCKDMDLYDFKSHADLGSPGSEGSTSWGWTAPGGREFIAIGQTDGTAFAEITSRGKLVYLGRLPSFVADSIWHEMKSYRNYMIIGSESVGHGVQIFDMTKLMALDGRSPKNFTKADLTGFYGDLPVGRAHNMVVNNDFGYAVAVGAMPRSDKCAAGLIFIDLSDVSKPTSPGCASADGYVHDAQCLRYKGPDTRYSGRDICYGYNEDTLTIYDVTDKRGFNASRIISRTPYDGASYTHQGWVLDTEWQDFLVFNDELDEEEGVGPAADGRSVSFIVNIRDLERPRVSGFWKNAVRSIDHNLFIADGIMTESNYGSGLHMMDVSSIRADPTGRSIEELAFFDIYPEDDGAPGGGIVDFVGTWSHYPYFQSGYIFVNTIERGGFVVKASGFPRKAHGRRWGLPGKFFPFR